MKKIYTFHTGLDNGVVLTAGTIDTHFFLTVNSDPDFAGHDAFVANLGAENPWMLNSATSQWIAPRTDVMSCGPTNTKGDYNYRLTFELTKLQSGNAVLFGMLAADDSADVILNGNVNAMCEAQYDRYTPFTFGAGFAEGKNTLDFAVYNAGWQTGIKAEICVWSLD